MTAAVPEVLKPAEVAAILRCSTRTVQRLVKNGELRAVTIGTRLRFTRQQVSDYLDGVAS